MKNIINIEMAKKAISALPTDEAGRALVVECWDEDGYVSVFIPAEKPEGAQFTELPLAEDGTLYYRHVEDNTVEADGLIIGIHEERWEYHQAVTPDDIGDQDYYNMVLTVDKEWCFAPRFKEAAIHGSMKYTTPEFEKVELAFAS